jgi:hypothetical protein
MRRAWPHLARVAWAAPNSLLGLALGAMLCLARARFCRVDDTLEFTLRRTPGELPRWLAAWPYRALTLGHVVLAMSELELARYRAHERVHVRQYERWGPAFLPAYAACSLWQGLRGRRAYLDNPFEVEARSLACQREALQASTL